MSDSGSAAPPAPLPPPPPNHLVWGVLATLLCCPPFGIASIVFSSQVNSKWASGDVAGAEAASAKAMKFAIWALFAAVVGILLSLFLIFGLHSMRAGE
jgi:Interferon-induced transmembrane protein